MTTAAATRKPQASAKRNLKTWIYVAVVVVVLAIIALGTKVVSDDDAAQFAGPAKFDAATYGAEEFPVVQQFVSENAAQATELAAALSADKDAAIEQFSSSTSDNPVFPVTLTGVVGEKTGNSYEIDVEGMPDDLVVRVQVGPAINGTDLRDVTGQISFGQFTNQIEFQNAGAALNEELKTAVLGDIDVDSLSGKTITLSGAFTSINPDAWLIAPTELSVQ